MAGVSHKGRVRVRLEWGSVMRLGSCDPTGHMITKERLIIVKMVGKMWGVRK